MIRKCVYEIIEKGAEGNRASVIFDKILITLICLNVLAVVLGSVDELHETYRSFFAYFEIISIGLFSIEYLARLWTAKYRYPSKPYPYLRYILSFRGIIDLCAILPFLVPFVTNIDLRIIRVLRIFRLLRVLKLNRYNNAFEFIGRVLKKQKEKLYITVFFISMMILLTSSVMYFIENKVQPEKFPNIPATMWWAVGALSTVGYGDVYPVTAFGQILGGIIAIMSIGMIAMPSGIISMGLIEEVREEEEEKKKGAKMVIMPVRRTAKKQSRADCKRRRRGYGRKMR